MAQGLDGNLYGTMPRAGTHSLGTVFKVTPAGQMTTLYNFSGPDGANPQGGVTLGPDGNFYGTTFAGGKKWPRQVGKGVIFKITPSGVLTVIHMFPTQPGADGTNPYTAPTLGKDGKFYGATSKGPYQAGVAYRFDIAGNYEVIGSLGVLYKPLAPLLAGADGNLYGTTSGGGTFGRGTVFALSTSGTVQEIHSFDGPHGRNPSGGLVQDAAGNLYGTTVGGGTKAEGVVFKVTLQGAFTVLHNFDGLKGTGDGAAPFAGLVRGTDGTLYGVAKDAGTQGFGVFFKVTTAGAYSVVASFAGSNGSYPYPTPTLHTNGTIYGLTFQGGTLNGGTFYSFTP
jgi:uncharacterized repeat protein (TIGR03803 family)